MWSSEVMQNYAKLLLYIIVLVLSIFVDFIFAIVV